MTRHGTSTAAEVLFVEQDTQPTAVAAADSHYAATIPDAVRRCRWIAADLRAEAFGVYFVSPASERSCLVPCFDSGYPGISTVTLALSGAQASEIARHARSSTQPRWWADDDVHNADAAFRSLAWIQRIAPPLPDLPGIAFPVHAESGQCGLVVFFGAGMVLSEDALCDIHARCFSLFGTVTRIHPGEAGPVRPMSRRELECLKLTANGYTSEEIARILKLSVHTANQYLTQSAQKLNAVNRTQAVAKALRFGLIE